MKIEILDEAEADLIEDFHFYEPQKPDSAGISWTHYFPISILSFYTLESTTLFSDIIAVSPRDSLLPSIIQSMASSSVSMEYSIAVAIRRGHESV